MTCKVEDCERAVRKVGMCGAHYAAAWRARNPGKVKAAAERAKADGRAAAATQRWRERNPEKVKEQARRRYAEDTGGQAERSRRWKKDNPDKVAALVQKYRADGRLSEAQKKWRAKNPDYERNWNAANPESRRMTMRKWQEKNKVYLAAYHAAYLKANPNVSRRKYQMRRTRKQQNGCYFVSNKDMRRLYSSPCFYCGKVEERMTVDHLIPLSRGGRHSIGNLVPACTSCNCSKSAWLPVEFRHRKLPILLGMAS